MRVAVITPYYKETDAQLTKAHDSVMALVDNDYCREKGVEIVHVMVSDGFPNPLVDTWDNTVHIKLPHMNDYGDTPRAVGGAYVANRDFDGAMLLDADNWFEPDHLKLMLGMVEITGAKIVTATRTLVYPDGRVLGTCTESNGQTFNDTNCFYLTSDVFGALASWGYKDRKLGIIGDRYFWRAVQSMKQPMAHCSTPSVNYVTTFAIHYWVRKAPAPVNTKVICKFPDDQIDTMYSLADYLEKRNALVATGKYSNTGSLNYFEIEK